MVKKFLKKTLSIVLVLAMLLTTFSCLDIGSLDIFAAIRKTENEFTENGVIMPQVISVPETIYIKPGASTFQYFANISDDGVAIPQLANSSTVTFKNLEATNIKLFVNNVYNKDTGAAATGKLKLGGSVVSFANAAYNRTTALSGTALATAASGSLTYNLTTSGEFTYSADDWGKTFIIEWVFQYTINEKIHFAFAYTGIYVTSLLQAGMITAQRNVDTIGNVPHSINWSFITGAHAYGGGNYKTKYTETVNREGEWHLAPLISFVGEYNDKPNRTIYGGETEARDDFEPKANGGIFAASAEMGYCSIYQDVTTTNKEDVRTYETAWTAYGNIDSPVPDGNLISWENGDDSNAGYKQNASAAKTFSGVTTGVAYMAVDTSRYNNFNQIPYLSAGWAQFYHTNDNHANRLNYIQSVSAINADTGAVLTNKPSVQNVSTGNFTGHDTYSATRGLYNFFGEIPVVPHSFIVFDYKMENGLTLVVDLNMVITHQTVGLSVQTIDKTAMRSTYVKNLQTYIDYCNMYDAGKGSDYQSYYNSMKTLAGAVCDPTHLDSIDTSGLESKIVEFRDAIQDSVASIDVVMFYAPEVIYLTPKVDAWIKDTSSTFQYYIQNNVVDPLDSSSLTTNPTPKKTRDTTGKLYFQCKNANGVTFSARAVRFPGYGDTFVGMDANNPGSITIPVTVPGRNTGKKYWETDITGGTSPVLQGTVSSGTDQNKTNYTIEWTATWNDTKDGMRKTAVAYTFVYKPYTTPIAGGLTMHQKGSGAKFHNSQLTWMSGFHYISQSATVPSVGDSDKKAAYPIYSKVSQGKTGAWSFSPFLSYDTGTVSGDFNYPIANMNRGKPSETGSDTTDKRKQSTAMYLAFADSDDSKSYFKYKDLSNYWAHDWMSTAYNVPSNGEPAQNATYNELTCSFYYYYTGGNKELRGCIDTAGVGGIYIDTSRYDNLNQIPNLGVGMMMTDNRDDNTSANGAWMIGDFTGKTSFIAAGTNDNGDQIRADWGNVNYYIAGMGGTESAYRVDGYDSQNLKYAGNWNREITGGETQQYMIHSAQLAQRSDHWNLAQVILKLDAKQFDKSKLRKTLADEMTYKPYLQDSYFNDSDNDYKVYKELFSSAYRALTRLDGAGESFTDSNGASHNYAGTQAGIDKICDDLVAARKKVLNLDGTTENHRAESVATQYNVGLIPNGNRYELIEIGQAVEEGTDKITLDYHAYDTLVFSKEAYDGFTFLGYNRLGNHQPGTFMNESDFQSIQSQAAANEGRLAFTYATKDPNQYNYTYYYLVNPDVLFDNYFDFDAWYSDLLKGTTGDRCSIIADFVNNSVDIKATSLSNNVIDSYTTYGNFANKHVMTLTKGHTYRLTYDVENIGSYASNSSVYVFHNNSTVLKSMGGISLNAGAAGSYSGEFTVGDTYNDIQIRFGVLKTNLTDAEKNNLGGFRLKFSNICIQDITQPVKGGLPDDVTTPSIIAKQVTSHLADSTATVGELADISRTGFEFKGWFSSKDANTNGTGTQYTESTLTTNKNIYMWSKWQPLPEITFDNIFDFDTYASAANYQVGAIIKDVIGNRIQITRRLGDTDGYYYGHGHRIQLIPGHTYKFIYQVDNKGVNPAKASFSLIINSASGGASWSEGTQNVDYYLKNHDAPVTLQPEATSYYEGTFTCVEGKEYVALRLFAGDGNTTRDETVMFSNIYLYDITSPAGVADNLTVASPINKPTAPLVELGALASQNRDGYTLEGWYDQKNGGTEYTEASNMPASGNLHLFSHWTVNTYTILYDMNDDSVSRGINDVKNPSTATYDVAYAIYAPVRPGYTFTGWKLEGEYASYDNAKYGTAANNCTNAISATTVFNGDPVYIKNLVAINEQSATLVAQWEAAPIRFYYDNLFSLQGFLTNVTPSNNGIILPNTSEYGFTLEAPATAGTKVGFNIGSNNSTTNASYRIPVVQGREYQLSYYQNTTTAADGYVVSVAFLDNAGNAIPLENYNFYDEQSDGAGNTLYYSDFTSGDGIATTKMALSWVASTKCMVANYCNDGDSGFPGPGSDYGYVGFRFKTPDNAATLTISFEVPAGGKASYKDIILRDMHQAPYCSDITDVASDISYSVDYSEYYLTDANFESCIGDTSEPTFYGYRFLNWCLGTDCSSTVDSSLSPANYPYGITAYSHWASDKYKVVYDNNGVTSAEKMPSDVSNIAYNASTADIISNKIPSDDDNVFVGWNTETDGSGDDYYPGDPVSPKTLPALIKELYAKIMDKTVENPANKQITLYAQWVPIADANTAKADREEGKQYYQESLQVVTGITVDDSGKATASYESDNIKKFADGPYSEYEDAIDDFDGIVTAARTSVDKDTKQSVIDARDALTDKASALNSNLVDIKDDYYNHFTIDGSIEDEDDFCSLNNMNLNKYKVTTLDAAQQALKDGDTARYSNVGNKTARKAFDSVNGVSAQAALNAQVLKMAEAYVAQEDKASADPVYNVYESNGTEPSDIAAKLGAAEGVYGINYVYSGKGNYTYYCYTCNPITTITLDVVQNAALTTENVAYPTRSDFEVVDASTTSTYSGDKGDVKRSEVTVSNDKYSKYLNNSTDNPNGRYSIGNTYTDTVNSSTKYTGAEYYNKKSVVSLTSRFADNDIKKTVSYKISSWDDSYTPNYATQTKLAKGKSSDYASTATGSTAVTPENTLTIIVEYKPKNGFCVTTDQVNIDTWLGQFHLFRTAGGASNWEFPLTGDSVYTVYDSVYEEQNDFASFVYIFNDTKISGFAPLTASEWDQYQSNSTEFIEVANNKKLTGSTKTNLEIVRDYIETNHDEIVKKPYQGRNSGGDGLGYWVWPQNGWSSNFYPANMSYIYFHVIDRWGNIAEGIAPVPNIDAIKPGTTVSANKMNVSEVGGSGLASMSIGKNFEIITDDNSTFENNVFRTAGNTITLKTGAANTNYTLTVLDNVGNKSTATFKSDANGILVIEVEDEAYNFDGTALTFMFDKIQVNLYDGVEKHIRKVEGDKIIVGSIATIGITTCSDVTMAQIVNEKGDTLTTTDFIDNGDGTRTWYVARTNLKVGEYTFGTKVKVGKEWIDEGKTATVTVLEKPASDGKVVDVDYTPVPGAVNTYEVKIEDRANMLQFVELDHGEATRSFDRYSEKVVITSYDNEGNEVDSQSRTLAYEIWTVTTQLADGAIGARVKERGSSKWEDMSLIYTFENNYAKADSGLKSAKLAAEWGKTGPVYFTVIAGAETQYVQLKTDAGSTATIAAEKATVNEDGTLTFTGKVWFNHTGDNTAAVRILDANGWTDATELYYYAEG